MSNILGALSDACTGEEATISTRRLRRELTHQYNIMAALPSQGEIREDLYTTLACIPWTNGDWNEMESTASGNFGNTRKHHIRF